LSQVILLLTSRDIDFKVYQMCLLDKSSVFEFILNQVASRRALKPILAIPLKYTSNHSSVDNPQGLFILILVSSYWLIPSSFNLPQIQLLLLNESKDILNYLTYVYQIKYSMFIKLSQLWELVSLTNNPCLHL